MSLIIFSHVANHILSCRESYFHSLQKKFEMLFGDKLEVVRMHQQQENLKFMSHFKRKIVIKKGIRPTPRSEPKKKNVEFYELRANGGSIPTRCIQVREIGTCLSPVYPFPTTVKPV